MGCLAAGEVDGGIEAVAGTTTVAEGHPAERVGGAGVGGGIGAAERAAEFVGDDFEEEVGAEIAEVVEVDFEDIAGVESKFEVGFVVTDLLEIIVAVEGDRLEEGLCGSAGERLAEGGGDAGEEAVAIDAAAGGGAGGAGRYF